MGVREAGKMFLIRRTLYLNRDMYDKEMRYISEYRRSKWAVQGVSSLRLGHQVPRKKSEESNGPPQTEHIGGKETHVTEDNVTYGR